MKRIKGFFSVFIATLLLMGCNNNQESAVEEIYAKNPSWIVKETGVTEQKIEKSELVKQVEDDFQIHFIDVGQGDSTLIMCDGHAMLIDAGDNSKGTVIQKYLKKLDIDYLDIVVATHPDADHIGGMDVVLQKFDCGKLLLPDVVKDTKTYEDLVNVIENKNINTVHPYTGTGYGLGSAQVDVLSPYRDNYEDVNDFSIVLKISYGNTNFLFTGDATMEVEKEMLENHLAVNADVIKIGHHGSRTSGSVEFITAVGAKNAVISCGKENEYGHPNAATLNTLRTNNIDVYRTDEQGTIILYSDGNAITFNCAPSDTWQAGEYTGQNQSDEGQDGNVYTKYSNPEAFLKFQYDGKDKEAVRKCLENEIYETKDDMSEVNNFSKDNISNVLQRLAESTIGTQCKITK